MRKGILFVLGVVAMFGFGQVVHALTVNEPEIIKQLKANVTLQQEGHVDFQAPTIKDDCYTKYRNHPSVTVLTAQPVLDEINRRGWMDLNVGGTPSSTHVYCLQEDIRAPLKNKSVFNIWADHILIDFMGHDVINTDAQLGGSVISVNFIPDDVMFDGNGATLRGFGAGIGSYSVGRIWIEDFRIEEVEEGIRLGWAESATLLRNSIENKNVIASRGIYMYLDARNGEVSENVIRGNFQEGVYTAGYVNHPVFTGPPLWGWDNAICITGSPGPNDFVTVNPGSHNVYHYTPQGCNAALPE